MQIIYPITLDTPVEATDGSGNQQTVSEIDEKMAGQTWSFDGMSGYDSSDENEGKGLRVTNLVGTTPADLRKSCPKCYKTKNMADFGEARTTNERRDQSNCNDCRNSAFIKE